MKYSANLITLQSGIMHLCSKKYVLIKLAVEFIYFYYSDYL